MKKSFILMCMLLFAAAAAAASPSESNNIISRTNPVYDDFYYMANDGLIKSADPDLFKYSPITEYEAAKYVVEAANNLYAAKNDRKKAAYITKLRGYFETYRKKAFEIYNSTLEMRKKVKQAEETLSDPEAGEFKEFIDEAHARIYEIEMEHKKTTFRGIPPFKVQGMLNVRWQDVSAFGVAPVHHTSLGGTFMSLWTEGVINEDINFKLNITFEKPANEAEKDDLPEYWGTGQRFLDRYTINLGFYGWTISTGFFWEDITPFIAKATLSERPALFEKDPYGLEETSKGRYENAFYHSFVKRGEIWSMHGFYGIAVYNQNLFDTGARLKIMGGKAEQFDEQYDKLYLYEFAGRLQYPFETGVFYDSYAALNFFNTSNEEAEIQTLAPDAPSDNAPAKPDGFIKAATIFGGDFSTNIMNLLKIKGELEISDYHGYMPKPFSLYPDYYPPRVNRSGSAFYLQAGADDIPIPVDFELNIQRIDPGYVAEASAVIDTAIKKIDPDDPRHALLEFDTYSGDPTLFYNNTQRMSLRSSIKIPGGFLNILYGSATQVQETTNHLYVDHFVVGNRLTGPMWWHLFYSQYGYPVAGRDMGYFAYNAPDAPPIQGIAPGEGKRYLWTDEWLENKELIVLEGDPAARSFKYTNNLSAELKLALHKIFGLKNNLFLQGYYELVSVWPDANPMVTYVDSGSLFTQNLMSAFIYYNLSRRIGIMAEASVERWNSDKSVEYYNETGPDSNSDWENLERRPVDYFDTSIGFGIDYDFAPRTSLHLRAKTFAHTDTNYPGQDFDGWHLFMEIKNFF